MFTQTTGDQEGYAIRDPDSTTYVGAIPIVDFFHARQHLWDLARKLYPNQEAEQRRWMMVHQDLLDEGKIEELVTALRAIDASNPEVADKIRVEAGYFENNTERMRYPKFRGQHLFVGSGVIEAGCKASSVPDVSIPACCGPSMAPTRFWLRCQFSDEFEDYGEARRA